MGNGSRPCWRRCVQPIWCSPIPTMGWSLPASATALRRLARAVTLDELLALRRPGRCLIVYHHQTRRPGGHHGEMVIGPHGCGRLGSRWWKHSGQIHSRHGCSSCSMHRMRFGDKPNGSSSHGRAGSRGTLTWEAMAPALGRAWIVPSCPRPQNSRRTLAPCPACRRNRYRRRFLSSAGPEPEALPRSATSTSTSRGSSGRLASPEPIMADTPMCSPDVRSRAWCERFRRLVATLSGARWRRTWVDA